MVREACNCLVDGFEAQLVVELPGAGQLVTAPVSIARGAGRQPDVRLESLTYFALQPKHVT